MNVYHFSFSVEADVEGEDIDEAWMTIKERMHDRFWGPTAENVELIGKAPEEEEVVE